MSSDHFHGRDALHHMVQVQANGLVESSEIHGAETPGSIFAGCDAARETALALLLLLTFGSGVHLAVAFAAGYAVWKAGRASWLAWSRLERLHRVANEEQFEIEHNRPQEREELKALYAAKGFSDPLLDEVIDVLMADGDRLLRVMLQEEMGFRLEENEHPLVQGLGAIVGSIVGALLAIGGYAVAGEGGLLLGACVTLVVGGGLSASYEHNRAVPAMVWNVGIALLAYVVAVAVRA